MFTKKFTLQMDKLFSILKVGLPTAIQMVVVNTAYLLVTGMLNQFGTSVSAASGVGLQINTFAGMPCWAIGQAVTAMVGQCIGAGEIKRARKVVKIGLLLNISVTLVVVIGVQIFAEQLILLFGSTSAEVINDGVYYLRVCCGVNSLIYAGMYTLDSFCDWGRRCKYRYAQCVARCGNCTFAGELASCLYTKYWAFRVFIMGRPFLQSCPAIVGFLYFQSKGWERKTLIQKKS